MVWRYRRLGWSTSWAHGCRPGECVGCAEGAPPAAAATRGWHMDRTNKPSRRREKAVLGGHKNIEGLHPHHGPREATTERRGRRRRLPPGAEQEPARGLDRAQGPPQRPHDPRQRRRRWRWRWQRHPSPGLHWRHWRQRGDRPDGHDELYDDGGRRRPQLGRERGARGPRWSRGPTSSTTCSTPRPATMTSSPPCERSWRRRSTERRFASSPTAQRAAARLTR
mmetsp:Transcript_11262/g.31584  ORF Transcript_11262/g.31584 Transcript_11262/m.31584 type:complete len:223 (-) Transcript_11262:779-1447(-)